MGVERCWLVFALLFCAQWVAAQTLPLNLLELRSAQVGAAVGRTTTGGVSCANASALQTLVSSPGTRTVMYLVAHDDKSLGIAKEISTCHLSASPPWLHIKLISSTPFFESILYTEVLQAEASAWRSLDYVITGTYKTVSGRVPRWEHVQTFDEITRLLRVAKQGNWDVVPFLRSGSGMMSNCLYWHKKGYKLAWDALLGAMNYSYPTIRKHYEMKPFFRNVYIIKTSVLSGLVAFMRTAMQIARDNTQVKELLSRDSNYKEGSAEVAKRIFGTPYYQLHPFLFERLPAFYLEVSGATVCHADKGECAFNT